MCIDGKCETSCDDNGNCRGRHKCLTKTVNDAPKQYCGECLVDTDCTNKPGVTCEDGKCKWDGTCTADDHCNRRQVCDTVGNKCVACTTNNHCNSPRQVCVDNQCVARYASCVYFVIVGTKFFTILKYYAVYCI